MIKYMSPIRYDDTYYVDDLGTLWFNDGTYWHKCSDTGKYFPVSDYVFAVSSIELTDKGYKLKLERIF